MGSVSVSTKKALSRSSEGRPPYDELSMFRIMVLQNLYNLSDRQMEEMLYDRLSFRRFCGFGLEATLPDATTILRFRSLLQGQSEKLLALVNEELSEKGITWAGGSIIMQLSLSRKAGIRSSIERTFAHLKTLFGYRKARYKGWEKNQVHLDFLSIAYNLKRSSRLITG